MSVVRKEVVERRIGRRAEHLEAERCGESSTEAVPLQEEVQRAVELASADESPVDSDEKAVVGPEVGSVQARPSAVVFAAWSLGCRGSDGHSGRAQIAVDRLFGCWQTPKRVHGRRRPVLTLRLTRLAASCP